MSRDELARRARTTVSQLGDVPLPGDGRTRERLAVLRGVGRDDLSVARLVEPHLDAMAIRAEAGDPATAQPATHPIGDDCLYAVWASTSPTPPRIEPDGEGRLALTGLQPFGSGALICDVALVGVRGVDDEPLLVAVDVAEGRAHGTVIVDDSVWRSPAFAETSTAAVEFAGHHIEPADVVGPPGFYLERPGFWHGALGPAAVWAGGAEGLLDDAEDLSCRTTHQRVGLGEMRTLVWSMRALLDTAADEIDRDPDDPIAARRRALTVRHLVERQCTQLLEVFGRSFGPRPLAFDDAVISRYQELQLYVRQVHTGEDLEELGSTADEDVT